MTKNLKKVAVAKDVIAQVRALKYGATAGIYIGGLDLSSVKPDTELQTVLRSKKFEPCDVCAMGACFLSTVRLFNKFKVELADICGCTVDAEILKDKVAELFTRDEMEVIEGCFETCKAFVGYSGFQSYLVAINDQERLLFLMQVVVDNKGREVTLDDVKRAYLRVLIDDKNADLSDI